MDDSTEVNQQNSNDSGNYLITIADYASHHDLWNDTDNENLQSKLWDLMKLQSRRYTMGDSSSIPLEVAEELKKSIYFCVSAYFKTKGNMDENIQILKNTSLIDIFKEGQKEVLEFVHKGQQLLQQVNETVIDIGNISYWDTINAMPVFFKNYDISFMAHEIPCSIDYQLSKPISNLYGIAYINMYLQSLLMENEFCSRFEVTDIIALLQAGCVNYKQDLVNIFEFVFNNAMGLEILKRDVFRLDITRHETAELFKLSRSRNQEELRTTVNDSFNSLLIKLGLDSPIHKQYYQHALSELFSRIHNLKLTSFDGVFISCE